jgi:hypothetical protein
MRLAIKITLAISSLLVISACGPEGAPTATATEPFPSWLCLANLQYMDGFGELARAPGAAAELTEDAPGLEPMPLSLS